jgi:hypothetical protein
VKTLHKTTLIFALSFCSAINALIVPAHALERLLVKNDLKTAEAVVAHYCARDASGFVWSGLIDAERTAFTTWRESPQQDSFFVASSYEVGKATSKAADQAEVEVHYQLKGVGDAHGTRMPASEPSMTVKFGLRRVNGAWKIVRPESSAIMPVVLESKFPFASE